MRQGAFAISRSRMECGCRKIHKEKRSDEAQLSGAKASLCRSSIALGALFVETLAVAECDTQRKARREAGLNASIRLTGNANTEAQICEAVCPLLDTRILKSDQIERLPSAKLGLQCVSRREVMRLSACASRIARRFNRQLKRRLCSRTSALYRSI